MLMSPIASRWVQSIHSLFLITIFTSFGFPSSPIAPSERIDSALQQQIVKAPNSLVRIIVQENAIDQPVKHYISSLGGEIISDLSIINALAVELPANRVAELARHSGVRWVSLDAPVQESGCKECISTNKLKNVYNAAIHADQVWNESPYLQGQGITVAVVDSGINGAHDDFAGRLIAQEGTRLLKSTEDYFGHGTFVAGIIAGDGDSSNGEYIGIAPKANLINVKVSGKLGSAFESDVIKGLQWIYNNKDTHNIRVVNISINASTAQSYHTSPLAAACEILWFNGVVVVVSSGNRGENAIYPPANDPFVITVGATDDRGTPSIQDDTVASFSAFGVTMDGTAKPDIVAPGRHLVGPLASTLSELAVSHPTNIINRSYFMMSGTSASAPVVSGAVALLLQDEPTLTPDQVKYRLLSTANKDWRGFDAAHAGAGYLDINAAIHSETTESANTGTPTSHLLTSGSEGIPVPAIDTGSVSWNSVSWNSVSWNSVSWNSVSWNSVSWNSVSWNSDYWDSKEEIIAVKKARSLSIDGEDKESMNTELFLPLISSTAN